MSIAEAFIFTFMCLGFGATMSHLRSIHRKLDALESERRRSLYNAVNALKESEK